MRDVIQRTRKRLLAGKVKAKFAKPEPVANVRVLADGVVAAGQQIYNSDTAGQRPGAVIEAVNVGSKAKAHWRAKFGSESSSRNGGLTRAQKQEILDMIQGEIDDSGTPGNTTTPPTDGGTDPIPIEVTVSPDTGVFVSGYVGGTFTGSQVYTITNNGSSSIDWTAQKSYSWLTLSASSGTLTASASTTVTVSIDGAAAAALGGGEFIDIVIFNAAGATIASRVIHLSVLNIGLEDVIRGVIGPVSGGAGTFSFTFPDDLEEGDGVIWFLANGQYQAYADLGVSWYRAFNYSEAASDYWYDTYGDPARIHPGEGLTQAFGVYVAGASDAGTTVNVTMEWEDPSTGVETATLAYPVFFAVIIKSARFTYDESDVNGDYISYPYTLIPGPGTGTATGGTPCPDFTTYTPTQIVFFTRSVFGGASSPTPFGATELCDVTNNETSLFVAAKMVNQNGAVVLYPTESINNTNSIYAVSTVVA